MSLLEAHLALLEREVGAPSGSSPAEFSTATNEAVDIHLALFEMLEKRIGNGGLEEQHRELVPLFERWVDAARLIVKHSASAASKPARLDDLLRAINRAKPAAEHFDRTVALNQRARSGELGAYRPLSEVLDGIRSGS